MKQLTISGYQSPTVQQFCMLSALPFAQVSKFQLKELEEVPEEW